MLHLWFAGFVAALAAWLTVNYLKNRKRWNMIDALPGFRPKFLIGNVPLLKLFRSPDLQVTIADLYQVRLGMSLLFKDEGIYRFWVGRRPIVILANAEAVEPLLASQVSIEKSDIYEMGSEWVGDGLATSAGDIWRRDRKRMTPTFHFRILQDFLPIMNEQASVFVEKVKSHAVGKEWFDLAEFSRLCALDIILETSMGAQLGAQKKHSKYATMVQAINITLTKRMYQPWLHNNFIYFLTKQGKNYLDLANKLNSMTNKLIDKRRAMLEKKPHQDTPIEKSDEFLYNAKKRLAFLDLLLETDMTEKELREQVSTFVFAGHHTIASSLMWLLYVIGLYPEVQDKVAQEIDSIFEGDNQRDVTSEDLKKLRYMNLVMKETQRIYPTAPIIARELVEDLKIGKYVIPKGTDCGISIGSVHRNPDVYPDPERFDPERFLPENCVGRNPYAFIPFSAGPRNCIGQRYAMMELQVSLCYLVRVFRFRSLDPRDKVHVIPDINLRPLKPLRIEVIPRKSTYIVNPEPVK